jgi:hypothetical protein
MALSAQITLNILAHETSSGDLSRTLRATPASYALSLADGTAASQAQVVWSDSRTLAGASETLNLSSLSDTRDGAAAIVSVVAVKALYAKNTGTATLTFAGSPFSAGGQAVAPGGAIAQCDPTAAGMAASGVTVTGSVGCTYDIILIGEGSVT